MGSWRSQRWPALSPRTACVYARLGVRVFPSAAALLMGLGYACDEFLHAWDERYHALVALHLTRHPEQPTLYEHAFIPSTQWGLTHLWVHKPPLATYLIALSLALFGRVEPSRSACRVFFFSPRWPPVSMRSGAHSSAEAKGSSLLRLSRRT